MKLLNLVLQICLVNVITRRILTSLALPKKPTGLEGGLYIRNKIRIRILLTKMLM